MGKDNVKTGGSMKWVKEVRVLPSEPGSNDVLKVEYIDVNLKNSRKLILNLAKLTKTNNQYISRQENVNETLIRLHNVNHELGWLGDL